MRMSHTGLKKMSVLIPRLLLAPVLARSSLRSSLVVVFACSCLPSLRYGERLLGDFLADLGGRRRHDVQVSRIRRQIVPGALDFDEGRDKGLAAGVDRRVVELRLVE